MAETLTPAQQQKMEKYGMVSLKHHMKETGKPYAEYLAENKMHTARLLAKYGMPPGAAVPVTSVIPQGLVH